MSKNLFSSRVPYVCRNCMVRLAYSRPLISSVTRRFYQNSTTRKSPISASNDESVEQRIEDLGGKAKIHKWYAEVQKHPDEHVISANAFVRLYGKSPAPKATGHWEPPETVTVYGRVTAKRKHSAGLAFLTIATSKRDAGAVEPAQVSLNYNILVSHNPRLSADAVANFVKKLKRGDWIAVRGTINETRASTLIATDFPQCIAPALQTVPLDISDKEFLMRNRHADQIVHPAAREIIIYRSLVLKLLRKFLSERSFVEVTTPLLQANAGGAIARPFETVATEFSDLTINLRVAPELYLKRLIIGGMERIYEIGPAFRNEGVDTTHNPEFTICEFYGVMMDLQKLMSTTQRLFDMIARMTEFTRTSGLQSLSPVDHQFWKEPYRTVDFIPALVDAIRTKVPLWKFPRLEDDDAFSFLMDTFHKLNITIPANPSIPRLLDALAGKYLEPQCDRPTFIIHQPECMAPLAKSFSKEYAFSVEEERATYVVSKRAELFIRGREYVNCYEEENSPIEQRRKFEEQLKHRHEADGNETHGAIDENYLSALEWGMPPTGGWGCGIDRILMLFAGKDRIADVLPFGTLRNVIALGNGSKKKSLKESQYNPSATSSIEPLDELPSQASKEYSAATEIEESKHEPSKTPIVDPLVASASLEFENWSGEAENHDNETESYASSRASLMSMLKLIDEDAQNAKRYTAKVHPEPLHDDPEVEREYASDVKAEGEGIEHTPSFRRYRPTTPDAAASFKDKKGS